MIRRLFYKRKPKVQVLVICTANICRSPVAEALLRDALKKSKMGRQVRVCSAGTRVSTQGLRPDPRMLNLCKRNGIATRGIRSVQVSEKAVFSADFVWVVDHANLEALGEMFPGSLGSIELFDTQGHEISDPFYGSRKDIQDSFQKIWKVSQARTEQLIDYCRTV